ncbi:MAG: hypothetical protein HC902_09660 [Calothrix sp. SM1_5_4]|nr:hypothetical protein [Calothrix sp. SM1_5_4]
MLKVRISSSIVSVLLCLSATNTAAKPSCIELLRSPQLAPDSAYPQWQLDGARTWSEYFGRVRSADGHEPTGDDERAMQVLRIWAGWQNISPVQRAQVRTFELRRFMPAANEANRVVPIRDESLLSELSAKNKERLLGQLKVLRPIPAASAPVSAEKTAKIRAMVGQFAIAYVHPIEVPENLNVTPPIPSDRELGKYGLTRLASFMSRLIGTSPSVEWRAIMTHASLPADGLGHL